MLRTNEAGRKVISRKTNMFIVQETRAKAPFRALPREFRDHILGNEKDGILPMKLDVYYQEFQNQVLTSVRCWKCRRVVIEYQPVYRRAQGGPKDMAEVTMANLNGKAMVVGALLPYSHYREGVFNAKATNGRLQPFSYIHCADCGFKDEDGPNLLACHLGGIDVMHEKNRNEATDDDAWAQWMFRWSGVELIGRAGASVSPADIMGREIKDKQKGRP